VKRTDLRPPAACPVCGDRLHLTRLACDGCGTELAGHFPASEFGALDAADLDLLRVFLRSRGNMKDLERHLGVSYPTARARYDAVLAKLGLTPPAAEPSRPDPEKVALLRGLADGDVDLEEAAAKLGLRHAWTGRPDTPGHEAP